MALALSSISTARRRSRLPRFNALCASSFSGPLGGPRASLLARRLPLLLAPSARPTVSPGLLPWPYAQLRELGSLPGGQLGRLLLPGRASGRFAFRYPAIAGGRDLVTSLEPLGAFGVFGHIFCAFELSLFGGVCHAQAIGKIGCSHREL